MSLEKFNKRVAAIKKQTGKSHLAAQKQASRENKAKVSGKRKPAKKKKAGRPLYKSSFSIGGKKKRVGARKRPKKRVSGRKTGVRRHARSEVLKHLRRAHEQEGLLLSQIGSVATQRSRLKKQYEEQLAWKLLALSQSTKAQQRKKNAKAVSELKRKIRGLS